MCQRLLLLLLALSAPLLAQAPAQAKQKDDAGERAAIAAQIPAYPLSTCVLTGEPLGDKGVDVMHTGQLVRFCCKSCVKAFRSKAAVYVEKVKAAVVAAQLPQYPLKTCVISGEALGSMGSPIDMVHASRLVRLCCKGCVKSFERKPQAALAKVDKALMDAQRKTYPLQTCVVSNESLDANGGPKELLYGTRLVRFCCSSCIKAFRKDPAAYVTALDQASKKAAPKKQAY